MGILLPPLKECRLQYLQDIFSGRKSTLLQSQVPARHIPLWPQLALNNTYPQLVERHPDIRDYLPDPSGSEGKERLPDRDFVYMVVNALYPATIDEMIDGAARARKTQDKNLQDERWKMSVTPEWMAHLLRYEYKSSKYLTVTDYLQRRRAAASRAS